MTRTFYMKTVRGRGMFYLVYVDDNLTTSNKKADSRQ